MYQGYDWDVIRWINSRKTGLNRGYEPKPDDFGPENCTVRFGGPHVSQFYAVFCDGSVRGLSYDADLAELELLAVINDDGRAGGAAQVTVPGR
jgi:hypothetical protein